jgi:16S rRNA (uracil1498-N3)-methyltransferase
VPSPGPGASSGSASGWAAAVDSAAQVFLGALDDTAVVDGDDGHHLQRVLRLRPGQGVIGADGAGTWRRYVVGDVEPGRVRLEAAGPPVLEPRPQPRLAVAFALTKQDKPERVVQQLTELGIDRIVGVVADRSVVRWDAAQTGAAVERWRRVARGAAAQCRRARLPEVACGAGVHQLATHPGLILADVAGTPALDVPWPPSDEVIALIGPEGGFSDRERAMLLGVPVVSVGRHVLRAETAACVIAGCLTAHRARNYNSA